jgi:hypothetical protein
VRTIIPAVVALSLAATGAARGQDAGTLQPVEPGRLALEAVSANQQLAASIAARLRANANLRHYRVDVAVRGGIAELTGQVTDEGQRDEVLKTVQSVPGVEQVRDGLSAPATRAVVTVQATAPPVGMGAGGAVPPEPLPIFAAHNGRGMPDPHLQPPPLPPYAWPTFAPYNNYSRVGYPTQYPYEAWPFIGPMYPFPKVPLGWRAVTLRWQDGYWWYGREASGHDWWRIRYW